MKSYVAFVKKEWMEAIRTYKLMIIVAAFLLFGIMSPLFAKMLPEILASSMPEGITINIGEPVALDSWAQFFNNVQQMGMIVLIILFSGLMSNEFTKGTLINVLTKGLKRSSVILAKFSVASVLWTISYYLSFFTAYLYTLYYWKNDGVNHLFFSIFCFWLFGELLICIGLLGGIIAKNNYTCLLFTACIIGILFLINIFPAIEKINPIALASNSMAIISSTITPDKMVIPILTTVGLGTVSIILSIVLFNKKNIN